ncbi:MAG: hypothetical protein WC526_02780 [Patescibacteria group bacterium]
MRHYKSEYTFAKYKPYQNPWKRFFGIFKRKKQKNFYPVRSTPAYKINPFKKREKKPWTAGKIIGMILVILVVVWAGMLVYMPFFRINKIECSGFKNINEEEVDNYIKTTYLDGGRILPANDYFLVDVDKIQKGLSEKFSVQSIFVEKVFPNLLKVKVIEKQSSLIYDNGQKYFLLDDGGSVIKYLADVEKTEFQIVTTSISIPTNTPGTPVMTSSTPTTTVHIPNFSKIKNQFGSFPILYDERELIVTEKQLNILSSDIIYFIASWYSDLPKQGIEPQYFVLDNLNSGILIKTNKPWNIFVQPGNNYTPQLNNLKLFLKTIHPKEYIDLRFGERVYWK